MLSNRESAYRWVIEILLFLVLIAQAVAWFNPAPILPPIMKSLNLGLGAGGLVVSIVSVCMATFSLAGGVISERFGARRTAICGTWAMALGLLMAGYAQSLATLLASRIVQGIGYGLSMAPVATFMMGWFAPGEWAYINMVNSSAPFIGATLVFALFPVVYLSTGHSWNETFFLTGGVLAVIALIFTIFGREHSHAPAATEAAGTAHGGSAPSRSAMAEAIRMREVRYVAVALFGSVWTFELFVTFLPTYLHLAHGFSLEEGGRITAILPATAAVGGVLGGLGCALAGLRRPFLWPLQALMFLGAVGAVLFSDPTLIRLSMILFGAGTSGPLSATYTVMMELPGMTPVKMGAAFGFAWGVTFAGAFVSPFLGGAIANFVGLFAVLLVFSLSVVVATIALAMLPETGPGRRKQVEVTA
jgi:MFS family permease